MSDTTHLLALGQRFNSLSYGPQPVVFDRGEGMRLYDTEGRSYLDFLAGIAVSTLGHAHPRLVAALQDQVAKLLHISNAYYSVPQVELMSRLAEIAFPGRVFFCNSGAEANEAAIKLVRRFQREVRGQQRATFLVFAQSFHGRTYGALSATGQPKYHVGFEPMVPGFVIVPWDDIGALDQSWTEDVAGVIIEPVQGEGGIRPASTDFLRYLRARCDATGALLVFDEVQCGVGRTGAWFAHQRHGVQPDVLTLAKGIGGGVPLGAMVATEEAAQGFGRGSHATTYGGNPLATRAGLAVLDVIEQEGLLERTARVSHYFRRSLEGLAVEDARLKEVRGEGWMVGLELDVEPACVNQVVQSARERGLLLNTAGPQTLRFVPPLIAEEAHAEEAIHLLRETLASVLP